MSLSFIKLAYMAEFAVAFNLAFGEFRQDKTAKFLNEQFESLDNNCEGSGTDILRYAEGEVLSSPRYDGMAGPTWLSRRLAALDRMRTERQVPDPAYKPFRGFLRRLGVLTTDPQALDGLSKTRIFWVVLKGLPKGLLASFAYPNTENWQFPPCRLSVGLWALGILICGGIAWWSVGPAFAGTESGTIPKNSLFALHILQVLLGCTIALLVPRLLSVPAGHLIGRHPPSPRGRYFPMIMVVLTTVVLLAITIAEAALSVEMLESPAIIGTWYVLFGFLLGALLMPIIMFSGFLALESALRKWARWLERRAELNADDSITTLEKSLESKDSKNSP